MGRARRRRRLKGPTLGASQSHRELRRLPLAPTVKPSTPDAPAMWRSHHGPGRRITCPACGRRTTRASAREYDRYGDRWDREDKHFEYLCRPCHEELTHQRRDGLEDLLEEAGAGKVDRSTFLERFDDLSAGRSESVERG